MDFEMETGLAVLERTPRALESLLRGLPDGWIRGTEGPDTWSPFDVVGHLVHADKTDWIPRARMIMDLGEQRAFEPFDRFAMLKTSVGRTLASLLEEFAKVRAASLDTVRGWKLTLAQLALRGIHPDFGTVTLGQLLATWVVHDLDHISQIIRVMAKQYTAAVGPWSERLRVVRT